MNWKLNKIQYPVYNLGEGKRVGIWVQGCSLGCKGCLNQTLWGKDGGKEIAVLDVYNWIASLQHEYDGITISGGEPFQQYPQLIAFLHLIKIKTRLSVQCFTGYYLEELYSLFPDNLFLKYIDTLVDGRYIDKKHNNDSKKGSLNQTIYKIINEIPEIDYSYRSPNKWSLHVNSFNEIFMAGIPKKNELESLCNEILKKGYTIKFK